MKFRLDDDELAIQFEALAGDPADSWIRLRYAIRDYWTGEQHEIDDKIYLAASRPWFGGGSGGSYVRAKTGACASSICGVAGADFDHGTPTG